MKTSIINDSDFSYLENETVIYTYDISDKKVPKLLSTNVQDGSYVSSRMSGGFLYTISSKNMTYLSKDYCVPTINGKLMSCDSIYLPKHIESQEYTVVTTLEVNKSKDFCDSVAVAGGTSTVYASQNNLYLIRNFQKEKNISNTAYGKKT